MHCFAAMDELVMSEFLLSVVVVVASIMRIRGPR